MFDGAEDDDKEGRRVGPGDQNLESDYQRVAIHHCSRGPKGYKLESLLGGRWMGAYPIADDRAIFLSHDTVERRKILNDGMQMRKHLIGKITKWEQKCHWEELHVAINNEWIQIEGLPFNMWNLVAYEMIGSNFGGLVHVSEATLAKEGLRTDVHHVRGDPSHFFPNIIKIPSWSGLVHLKIKTLKAAIMEGGTVHDFLHHTRTRNEDADNGVRGSATDAAEVSMIGQPQQRSSNEACSILARGNKVQAPNAVGREKGPQNANPIVRALGNLNIISQKMHNLCDRGYAGICIITNKGLVIKEGVRHKRGQQGANGGAGFGQRYECLVHRGKAKDELAESEDSKENLEEDSEFAPNMPMDYSRHMIDENDLELIRQIFTLT
ncbi:hypothetical protein Scep_023376 [Stephania cephalantha]|uniref:DUF4283 domain-containing protein n=1 Tax=Stephania cephalantha TaxID=152367 RepID=A0AAP0HX85_9MAGN